MYADDTVVYTHAKTAAMLTIALERNPHWLDQSCLSLIVNKKKGMFFFFKPWYNLMMLIFILKVKRLKWSLVLNILAWFWIRM